MTECPKCHFSMEPLRSSRVLDRENGYLLDDSLDSTMRWWDPDNNVITSLLFGSLWRFLWRLLEPIGLSKIGSISNRRYRKLLERYPRSLICTHCEYVIKRE